MDRWRSKIAVVTGASSGIGAACVKDLAQAGMIVIGLARREEKMKELHKYLPFNLQSRVNFMKCDVSKEAEVLETFAKIIKEYGGIDVLVNNAGVTRLTDLVAPNNSNDMQTIVDTNIMATVYCVREAFNSMKSRNVDGHIVIVNSVCGHYIPNFPKMNIYPATKHAITAMTEVYRQEFAAAKTNVKVTSVSPGAVKTEMLPKEFPFPMLESENISDAILYVIGTPPHVQIHELTIKPLGEIF